MSDRVFQSRWVLPDKCSGCLWTSFQLDTSTDHQLKLIFKKGAGYHGWATLFLTSSLFSIFRSKFAASKEKPRHKCFQLQMQTDCLFDTAQQLWATVEVDLSGVFQKPRRLAKTPSALEYAANYSDQRGKTITGQSNWHTACKPTRCTIQSNCTAVCTPLLPPCPGTVHCHYDQGTAYSAYSLTWKVKLLPSLQFLSEKRWIVPM